MLTGTWSPHDEDENPPLDIEWVLIRGAKYDYSVRVQKDAPVA